LKEADAPRIARPFQNRFHQLPPDSARLYRRIDDNRANRSNRVSLAEKIEPNDPGVAFGYHSEHRRVSYETGHALRCYFPRGKTERIAVALIDGAKSLERNPSKQMRPHALASISVARRMAMSIWCILRMRPEWSYYALDLPIGKSVPPRSKRGRSDYVPTCPGAASLKEYWGSAGPKGALNGVSKLPFSDAR
jgi:hypothetical protein